MKKYRAVMGIIVCALLTAGCPDTDDNKDTKNKHTDPAFLVGRWVRTATADLPDFSISKDYSFECVVDMPEKAGKAKIIGKLDYKVKNLGPNDYVIRNMVTVDDEQGTYTGGNNTLDKQLGGFQDLLATLAPNENKTAFEFTASNQAAKMFFGGTYTKQ